MESQKKPQNQKSALRSAVNKLIKEKESVIGDGDGYVKTVVAAFEEIQLLRTKGVDFDEIFGLFKSSGLLPENANLRSFRQAFRREQKRRWKNRSADEQTDVKETPSIFQAPQKPVAVTEHAAQKADVSLSAVTTPPAKAYQKPVAPVADKTQSSAGATKKEGEITEEELMRKLGYKKEPGFGGVIKHSDGSFSY